MRRAWHLAILALAQSVSGATCLPGQLRPNCNSQSPWIPSTALMTWEKLPATLALTGERSFSAVSGNGLRAVVLGVVTLDPPTESEAAAERFQIFGRSSLDDPFELRYTQQDLELGLGGLALGLELDYNGTLLVVTEQWNSVRGTVRFLELEAITGSAISSCSYSRPGGDPPVSHQTSSLSGDGQLVLVGNGFTGRAGSLTVLAPGNLCWEPVRELSDPACTGGQEQQGMAVGWSADTQLIASLSYKAPGVTDAPLGDAALTWWEGSLATNWTVTQTLRLATVTSARPLYTERNLLSVSADRLATALFVPTAAAAVVVVCVRQSVASVFRCHESAELAGHSTGAFAQGSASLLALTPAGPDGRLPIGGWLQDSTSVDPYWRLDEYLPRVLGTDKSSGEGMGEALDRCLSVARPSVSGPGGEIQLLVSGGTETWLLRWNQDKQESRRCPATYRHVNGTTENSVILQRPAGPGSRQFLSRWTTKPQVAGGLPVGWSLYQKACGPDYAPQTAQAGLCGAYRLAVDAACVAVPCESGRTEDGSVWYCGDNSTPVGLECTQTLLCLEGAPTWPADSDTGSRQAPVCQSGALWDPVQFACGAADNSSTALRLVFATSWAIRSMALVGAWLLWTLG